LACCGLFSLAAVGVCLPAGFLRYCLLAASLSNSEQFSTIFRWKLPYEFYETVYTLVGLAKMGEILGCSEI
jgi:hypothetical protein